MENVFSRARFDLYRNGEAIQLAHDVVKACNDADATELKIAPATTALGNVVSSTDEAYDGVSGYTLTEEVIGLDDVRDDDIVGIKGVATGYKKHYNPNLSEAGSVIVKSLDKYSVRIDRENLATETTIIRNWYAEVTNDALLLAALVLLNLKDWADHLNTTNELFNTKYLLRSQDIGDKAQLPSVGDLLPTLKKEYSALIEEIAALHFLDKGKGTYTNLVNQIEALIEQYNVRAKARVSTPKTAAAKA
jgi:hypothetical protein